MNRLCTFGGAIVASYLGWALGAQWGIGWAFSISAMASMAGVWVGWKVACRLA